MSITIRPRSDWGAVPPSSPLISIVTPTPWVYIHHSAVERFGPPALREFQRHHMVNKDMRDIAYNFLIDRDSTIWEGRGWGKAHGGNRGADNSLSHSICLMGNFEIHALPASQEASLVALLREGKARGAWVLSDIRGHQQEADAATACPGDNVMARLPEIRRQALIVPGPTPVPVPIEEEIEMFLYSGPNTPVFFCDGGASVGLNEATDMPTFVDQKVKHFKLDGDTYLKFRDRFPGA